MTDPVPPNGTVLLDPTGGWFWGGKQRHFDIFNTNGLGTADVFIAVADSCDFFCIFEYSVNYSARTMTLVGTTACGTLSPGQGLVGRLAIELAVTHPGHKPVDPNDQYQGPPE